MADTHKATGTLTFAHPKKKTDTHLPMRLLIPLLLLLNLHALGQQTVWMMSYNLLNFPTGNLAGREDTLRTIIDHVRPDVFLIQELKNDSGQQLIVDRSFENLPGKYAAATFLPQQSGSDSFKLQHFLRSKMFLL